jgi:uncharacterized repeat protein (TIGR03803 family)
MKSKKFFDFTTTPLASVVAVLMLAGNILASAPRAIELHDFGTGTDGAAAYGSVISDTAGNLFGTTAFGGASGAGIVYELKPTHPGWT